VLFVRVHCYVDAMCEVRMLVIVYAHDAFLAGRVFDSDTSSDLLCDFV
jgi:hypothetical protein